MSLATRRYRAYLVRKEARIWTLGSLWNARAGDVEPVRPRSKRSTLFRTVSQAEHALDAAGRRLGAEADRWQGLVYDMQRPDPELHPPVINMAV